jgi:excisionase family DNA binding protein
VPYITPAEAAAQLRVTRRTLYRWIATGQLKAYKAGDKWLIDPEDVRNFLQENKKPAVA